MKKALACICYLTMQIFIAQAQEDIYSKMRGCGFKKEANPVEEVELIKSVDPLQKIKIPVVFHVVYGKAKQNIDTKYLIDELKDTNRDFQKKNGDTANAVSSFWPIIANPNIEFSLAEEIFEGQSEKGVIREKRGIYAKLYKASPVVHPEKYLNVYVGNIGSDGVVLDINIWEQPSIDAIFLDYTLVGQHGRLLTHETGHWLGLLHTFNNDCNTPNDNISDTPPQDGSTGFDYQCGKKVTNQCPGAGIPNYNNYMDYSACRCMFTDEQVALMRKVVRLHRPNFWHL